MIRDITFGQYYPADSFIHRLDPRTKILSALIFIVAMFVCKSYYSYLVCFSFLAFCILVSKIPLNSILKTVKAIIFVIVITVIINVFFYGEGKVLASWWVFTITAEGLIFASKMAMRLIFLVIGTSLITLTTTPMNLTDGLESLFKPLKSIGFPVHDVAIIMSIALRFIPTLMEEIDKIMMAQKARGASFDSGGLIKRAKALIPILIPLFVSTFKRADELALALDSRCYNATPNRTKMKKLSLNRSDALGLFFTLLYLGAIITLRVLLPNLI